MKRLLAVLVAAALAVGLAAAPALAVTLVVNDDPAGNAGEPPPCNVAPDYNTIQDALDNAAAGDTIKVCPGTYTEDLTMTTDNVELAGSGSASTTIVGVKVYSDAAFPECDIPNINIQANGVSVHDFTIQHPVVAVDEYSCGIVLTGTNITIIHNAFLVGAGAVSQGIQTWKDDNAPEGLRDISGLTIVNNSFSHLAPIPEGGLGYEGVYINPQSDATDPYNPVTINNNEFSGELIRAVTVQERPDTVVNNNDIYTIHGLEFGTFPRGIQLSGADGLSVSHNHIAAGTTGQFGIGIALRSGSDSNSVANNKISEVNTGVSVDGDDNKVVNNKIDCVVDTTTGVDIVSGSDNNVVRNRISSSCTEDVADGGSGTKIKP